MREACRGGNCGGRRGGGRHSASIAILLVEKCARASTVHPAIGNVDTCSIVVVVTVVRRKKIRRPCYIHLPNIVGAGRIGVVVDLHLFRS